MSSLSLLTASNWRKPSRPLRLLAQEQVEQSRSWSLVNEKLIIGRVLERKQENCCLFTSLFDISFNIRAALFSYAWFTIIKLKKKKFFVNVISHYYVYRMLFGMKEFSGVDHQLMIKWKDKRKKKKKWKAPPYCYILIMMLMTLDVMAENFNK